MLPQDPFILLSWVNTKLRDQYSSLDKLCDDLEVVKDDIVHRLADINYTYDPKHNQFI